LANSLAPRPNSAGVVRVDFAISGEKIARKKSLVGKRAAMRAAATVFQTVTYGDPSRPRSSEKSTVHRQSSTINPLGKRGLLEWGRDKGSSTDTAITAGGRFGAQ